MPLYEYECPSCGNRHTAIRPIAECKQPARCNKCGADMPRVVSTVGAIATVTRGGNWIHSTTTGLSFKGNRRPKTISMKNGLGGRRENPSQAKIMGTKAAV